MITAFQPESVIFKMQALITWSHPRLPPIACVPSKRAKRLTVMVSLFLMAAYSLQSDVSPFKDLSFQISLTLLFLRINSYAVV